MILAFVIIAGIIFIAVSYYAGKEQNRKEMWETFEKMNVRK